MDDEKDIGSSWPLKENNTEHIIQPDLLCHHAIATDTQIISNLHLSLNESMHSNTSSKQSKDECAFLTNNLQSVHLTRDNPTSINLPSRRRHLIPVNNRAEDYSYESSSDSEFSDNPDKFLNIDLGTRTIPELTAEEELKEERSWRSCTVTGIISKIDMKVIEPYKCVLSHGGYMTAGSHNAIIIFSACYLPHRNRVDYNYVMNNLFAYVISTLDQLVTEDYVLVYLQGGTSKDCVPSFSWLKRCYKMIDRKLRKNLKFLYMVHPTFWLKTLVLMIKPFVSSKFGNKIHFVNSLDELYESVPVERASIPDKVKQFDSTKSIPNK
ncbi:protein prune homolog 2-like isoform X1 [Adelges cooleyi]|uniref:protein prune homolog 2-like isoform X1 n=1 Tax=Adelges cooleyi TaxID=133065 RepID=UPI00217F7FD3|nr:protein prune homolog 2-like isoform X1 [Adelges cooleyi]